MKHRQSIRVDSPYDNLSSYERCARLVAKYAPFFVKYGDLTAISGTGRAHKKKDKKDLAKKKPKGKV